MAKETQKASQHVSFRIPLRTLERLDARSDRTSQSRSRVALTLIEEGLRMDAHPGIVFRDGPTGRRPGVVRGPDVWEVVRVLQNVGGRGEEAVERSAEWLELPADQTRAAARYYAEYRDEIDEWIRRVDREAERAEAAWRREQGLAAA